MGLVITVKLPFVDEVILCSREGRSIFQTVRYGKWASLHLEIFNASFTIGS